jgi:LPS export ABC transporter protein LptC
MRKRWELVVLAFGGVFLIFLATSIRPGRRPSHSTPRETLPGVAAEEAAGQPTTVSKGFDYTESVRGKPIFRIQSERTVAFGAAAGLVPNVYLLENVTLTLYPEQGAAVIVRSDKAEYDQRTKQARLSGNVRWTDDRGALGETERMEFNPSNRTLLAPEKILLSRGTFGLEARSAKYDVETREARLEGPIRGSGTGEEMGGLTSLASDSAVYRREQSLIELIGSVSGRTKAGDSISCNRMVFKLDPEGKHLEWSRADGSVKGSIVSNPNARAQAQRKTERHYEGSQATFGFGADGSLHTVALTGEPARITEGEGYVRARGIDLSFDAGRIASASAHQDVHIDKGKSRADSDAATLSFNEAGEMETLELTGTVRLIGEDRSGRCDKAVNLASRSQWVLTGAAGGSATVQSGASRISASRIEIDESKHFLRAEGNGRAVFSPGDTNRVRAPTLLGDPSRPTYGKAARITLDENAHVATLSGQATLWQDASSLSGDDVTLNDAERSVIAVGNTRTVVAGRAEAQKAAAPEPSVVVARRAAYRESDSAAQFDGSVTVARGSWHASGAKATAFFGKDRAVERVEIAGDVSLADQAQNRSGKAERAIDYTKEGRTILEGSPAWVIDGQGNRIAGAVLTITDRGRRVEVTAPEGGKTETTHRTTRSS